MEFKSICDGKKRGHALPATEQEQNENLFVRSSQFYLKLRGKLE